MMTTLFSSSPSSVFRALPARDHETQLRHRLLGLAILILVAVVVLPWVLTAPPRVPTVAAQKAQAPGWHPPAVALAEPQSSSTVASADGAHLPPVPAPAVDALPHAMPSSDRDASIPPPLDQRLHTRQRQWHALHAQYRSMAAALGPKSRIEALQLPVRIVPKTQEGTAVWQVWVGPFTDKAQAQQAMATLKRQQITLEKPRLMRLAFE